MKTQLYPEIRRIALDLLTRREHSRQELRRKLLERGFDLNPIKAALEILAKEGLQSDQRFAENYVSARVGRGFGPLYIAAELKERGISDDVIEEALVQHTEHWKQLVVKVRQKKFGDLIPKDLVQRAKQIKFLQYKGFANDHIKHALTGNMSDEEVVEC